jgi:hypothetical protein
VAIQYEIVDGVLILRVAEEGFAFLRDGLHAAAHEPAARPRMPILLDLRTAPAIHRYEDVRWRVQTLVEMRERFGPRWAFLTGPGPVRIGVGKMFEVFSRIEGVDVGVFAERDTALKWLREGLSSTA